MAKSEDKAAAKAGRRWLKQTRSRTLAKREAIAAEAQAGAASLLAPGIAQTDHDGAVATVYLRAGGILNVHVPHLGQVAVIKAGNGWATAIVSPAVLNGAPDSGGTGDTGDGLNEPWSAGRADAYDACTAVLFERLAPLDFTIPVTRTVKSCHWDWTNAQVNAEVQRLWTHMVNRAEPPVIQALKDLYRADGTEEELRERARKHFTPDER